MDVFRHQNHLFEHFLFEVEFPKCVLQLMGQFFEPRLEFGSGRLGSFVLPGRVLAVHLLVCRPDRFDQFAQRLEMTFPAINFLVQDDTVKPLFWRFAKQLLR